MWVEEEELDREITERIKGADEAIEGERREEGGRDRGPRISSMSRPTPVLKGAVWQGDMCLSWGDRPSRARSRPVQPVRRLM